MLPVGWINMQEVFEDAGGEIESLAFDTIGRGNPANRRVNRLTTIPHALEDPFEHTDVLAKARP